LFGQDGSKSFQQWQWMFGIVIQECNRFVQSAILPKSGAFCIGKGCGSAIVFSYKDSSCRRQDLIVHGNGTAQLQTAVADTLDPNVRVRRTALVQRFMYQIFQRKTGNGLTDAIPIMSIDTPAVVYDFPRNDATGMQMMINYLKCRRRKELNSSLITRPNV
jgi:hypothetical protein